MGLLLLGTSHHTAPIEHREQLALEPAALPAALDALAAEPGVREGMILSTCNRVEVVVEASEAASAAGLLGFLQRVTRFAFTPPPGMFYELAGSGVVRHVFRVASSLDSLVVGEPQILGQLKHAYAAAHAAGTIGTELEVLVSRAFHTAKRVRTETAIATQPVSVSQAAVDLARQIFGDLSHKTVLLIGAGAMGEAAARYLVRQGASRLLIANRSLARAQALAQKFNAEAFALEQLPSMGELADVVITSTGAPQPIITRTQAAHFLSRRRGRPMLFLDIAVPRDVEPSTHQLDNAFVYNIDDLDKVVNTNLADRRREAVAGESIIESEVALFERRRESRDVVPTLKALQEHAEMVRAAEWERVRKKFNHLTPDQLEAMEAVTRSLMNKWLHTPMVELKAANPADRAAMLEYLHRLYALEPRD